MIFFDTETTGLLKPAVVPLDSQPEMVEFAAIKVDDDLNEIDRLEFLCKPKKPIPPEVTKIHGITNEDVANKKPFAAHYKELCEFFLGETKLAAHNALFDVSILDLELRRLDLHRKFPWPAIHVCTMELVEATGRFTKKNLGSVHYALLDEEIPNAHRATADVEAMIRIYKELR